MSAVDLLPKADLLAALLSGVKGVQSRFGSRTELATEDDRAVSSLCGAFEDVFAHGLKKFDKSKSSLWRSTPTTNASNFWPLVKSELSKHEAERFFLLHRVRSDQGRARAWLRAALNEHSLERYIVTFLGLSKSLEEHYEPWAFLRDPELSAILPQAAAGLGSVLFALVVDNQVLDSGARANIKKDDAVASPVEVAEVADQFLAALNKERQQSSASTALSPTASQKGQKKKKKKPLINVVSFDDDGGVASSSSPVQISVPVQSPERSEIYSTSAKSMDAISINSVYSDCSERLDIPSEFSEHSQRLKPLGEGASSVAAENGEHSDSHSQDLIPLPNFDPCTKAPELDVEPFVQKSPKSLLKSPEIDEEIDGADRISKLKSILDREVENVAQLEAALAEERRKSNDAIKILEARTEALGKENELLKHQLKKYIGAVQLLRKEGGKLAKRTGSFDDEDDEQLLRIVADSALGEEEAESVAEYERKLIQVAEMHGELMEFNSHLQTSIRKRDQIIRRLREELVDLRGPLASAPLSDDLGQGQNHGLTLDSESWDIVDSGQSDSSGQSHRRTIGHLNERVLINIWIPSAFLTGANNDLHHVYQVFIRIKDTEWNVYRRYSQFYSFHRDLKKSQPAIASFYFPPKKHLGNKDGKFVDERRRSLQEYLRKVMNVTLQSNSILAAHPDKNLLISILPFFGETSAFSHTHTSSSSSSHPKRRGRKLFFLSTSSTSSSPGVSSQQVLAPASQNVPQYNGL